LPYYCLVWWCGQLSRLMYILPPFAGVVNPCVHRAAPESRSPHPHISLTPENTRSSHFSPPCGSPPHPTSPTPHRPVTSRSEAAGTGSIPCRNPPQTPPPPLSTSRFLSYKRIIRVSQRPFRIRWSVSFYLTKASHPRVTCGPSGRCRRRIKARCGCRLRFCSPPFPSPSRTQTASDFRLIDGLLFSYPLTRAAPVGAGLNSSPSSMIDSTFPVLETSSAVGDSLPTQFPDSPFSAFLRRVPDDSVIGLPLRSF